MGPNASGKTNLLEAVIALGIGSSFKAKDNELIQFNRPWARLEGNFDSHVRTLKIKAGEPAVKSLDIGTKTLTRVRLEHTQPLVLFEPNHLLQLTTSPQARRDYIDELITKTDPAFGQINRLYKRVLAQRNSLLKKSPSAIASQIFAWDVRLGELGSQIVSARLSLIGQLNQNLSKTYSQIAKKKASAAVSYKPLAPADVYATKLVDRLKKDLPRDIERGFTSDGPHREDISFVINGHPINSSASRGEIRSLLLALKILELDLVETAREQKAIFLLDDVFSELDNLRRQALVKAIRSHQAIITTTDADAVLDYFANSKYNLIPLKRR